MTGEAVIVKALKTQQGADTDVYAFFLPGREILRVAQISRIEREKGELKGFQRREIRSHVKAIAEFLDSGEVLFPNAIILALSPEVTFKLSRGPRPAGMLDVAHSGTLTIPVRPEGRRAAWIVDGQQRSLALGQARQGDLPVPVIGFVSADLETQREQFILVNKAKPLPNRLIDELLPEVTGLLPRDLDARRLPSELVNLLNRDPESPFHNLVKRESAGGEGLVTDTALLAAVQVNLKAPLGALSDMVPASGEVGDADPAYEALRFYWQAVRDTFADAWGKAPSESRLMHSAGIKAMGALMDYLHYRVSGLADPKEEVKAALARLAPHCAWTDGRWEGLELDWNEVQATPQHIARLRDHLVGLDRQLSRPGP